ncbi:type VI secretion system membrane subunit TssM [Parashewanella tropica]|uniref:type VI secretion system membrane subunit TssM n=1 Tax=Parashewanella tropica TaxID=2547970 RepID=UPI001059F554|nr:type VI secretion system membrane subunit TssM [Parashewanella tropica]
MKLKMYTVISLVLCIILSTLAWIIFPQLSWLMYPAIISIIITIGLCYFLYAQSEYGKQHKLRRDQIKAEKQQAAQINTIIRSAVSRIKNAKNIKHSTLYDLPWYLVLGEQAAGKSTLLKQNGLELLLDDTLKEQQQTYIRFWYNEDIICLEVGDKIYNGHEFNHSLWSTLSKQLLKVRPRQSLNGVVNLLNCKSLITMDRKTRETQAKQVKDAMLALTAKLKLSVPFYCVLAKVDVISDFIEFFDPYSNEELAEPLGITFDTSAHVPFQPSAFQEKVKSFLSGITQQQFELLFNINSEQTASVIALPYQLRLFFHIVSEWITELGKESRAKHCVWIRGVYFLNCVVDEHSYDILGKVIALHSEFNTNEQRQRVARRRHFFAQKLLQQSILPEAQLAGINTRMQMGYLFFRSTLAIGALLLIALTIWTLKNNWSADEDWRNNALTQLSLYKNDLQHSQQNPTRFQDVIELLSELRAVAKEGVAPKPWYRKVSLKQGDIAAQIYSIYESQLSMLLLPQLERLGAKDLSHYVEQRDSSKIFEVLRYYEMLSNKSKLETIDLRSYLLGIIKKQALLSESEQTTLSDLLVDLFNSNYQKRIKLNDRLVAEASNILIGLSPERLIYAKIINTAKHKQLVDVRKQLGTNFDSIFSFTPNYQGFMIPKLFTKQGYKTIDLSANSPTLKELMSEFEFIQKGNSEVSPLEMKALSQNVQRLYYSDYIRRWNDLLNNISIKHFTSSNELSLALHGARQPVASPVLDTLEAIVMNTDLINQNSNIAVLAGKVGGDNTQTQANKLVSTVKPESTVNQAFQPYFDYLKGTGDKSKSLPVDGLIQQFDQLDTYFTRALSSPNASEAMNKYAIVHASGKADPISNLELEAAKYPEQVKRWALSIAQQSWRLVMQKNMDYINSQWNDKVYQTYDESFEGRFPFYQKENLEVALDDFTQMFMAKGQIDSFITQYLTPFTYWQGNTLKLAKIDGIFLPMGKHSLDLLNQAQLVSRVFFGATGKKLSLNINLMPISMASRVTDFELGADNAIFSYDQGPRVAKQIQWPLDSSSDVIRSSFFSGVNRIASKSYQGPWGLLRFLFDGQSTSTNDPLVRRLTYRLNGNSIDLDYKLPDSKIILDSQFFSQLRLEELL